MQPKWLGFPLTAVLALWATGCATFTASRDVSVGLVNVLPVNASLFETSAELTVRVTNQTARPLAFAGSTHRLYLNDSYVGTAVSNSRLTVPEFTSSTQTVTVHLENLVLLRKFTELSNSRATKVAYRMESQLHPEGGGLGRVKALATGELDVSGLMEAAGGTAAGRITAPAQAR
jgi:LEA14-like dessication related protein